MRLTFRRSLVLMCNLLVGLSGFNSSAHAEVYSHFVRLDDAKLTEVAKSINQFVKNGTYKGNDTVDVCGMIVGPGNDAVVPVDVVAAAADLTKIGSVYMKALFPGGSFYSYVDLAVRPPHDDIDGRLRIIVYFGNESGYQFNSIDIKGQYGAPTSFIVGMNSTHPVGLDHVTDADLNWSLPCLNLTATK